MLPTERSDGALSPVTDPFRHDSTPCNDAKPAGAASESHDGGSSFSRLHKLTFVQMAVSIGLWVLLRLRSLEPPT